MYKLRFFLVLLICLFVFSGLSLAAENQTTDKKNVALIIVNNREDSGIKDESIKKSLIDPAIQKFSNRFVIMTDTKYYEKFKSIGLYSIIDLDKSDIFDVLKDENIDYGLVIQTLSEDDCGGGVSAYHSQMKIIDLRNNKLLYNGKFRSLSYISPQMNQILQTIDEILPKN